MELIELAAICGIEITGYSAKNAARNITTSSGCLTPKRIQEDMKKYLMESGEFEQLRAVTSKDFTKDLVVEARELQKEVEERGSVSIPEETKKILEGLKLYKDISFTYDKEPRFFLGTQTGLVSHVPAHHFITTMRIEEPELHALPAVAEYSPRSESGEYTKALPSGERVPHINTYIPAPWNNYEGELPDKLPKTFEKLINHIFPKQIDRDYFFHWVYKSLTSRAETYLILQGKGAIGKNRLKIILRALHGHRNSSDGKKSTLTGSFNSQLGENTLLYFDEISYTEKEENVMKEIPNGTVPIEGKFKDTTRGTRIFCSLVLANNRERDNFIDFESRKFTPLELNTEPLLKSMTDKEIAEMSAKVEFDDDPSFDISYIAQIGRWIIKHGEDPRWPNCEYRGPRFWVLANVSMAHWKKSTLETIFDPPTKISTIVSSQPFRYSAFQEAYRKEIQKKKSQDVKIDYTNAQFFFDTFRDLVGNKIFKTEGIPGSIVGDFTIEIIQKPMLASVDNIQEIEEKPEDLL